MPGTLNPTHAWAHMLVRPDDVWATFSRRHDASRVRDIINGRKSVCSPRSSKKHEGGISCACLIIDDDGVKMPEGKRFLYQTLKNAAVRWGSSLQKRTVACPREGDISGMKVGSSQKSHEKFKKLF